MTRESQFEVGVIGLGAMGAAFVRRYLAIGTVPLVYNRSPLRAEALAAEGAAVASSAADLARRSQAVITVLGTGDDVRAVYLGDDGVLANARPGALLIDCSTIDPATSTEIGEEAVGRGFGFADAGVGALPKDAIEGRVNFMVGARDEDIERVESVLGPLAARVMRCGGIGAGMTMKVINNLLANAIHVADLEAIELAERAGLDRDVVMNVLGTTAAGNNYLRDRVPAELVDTEHVPGFKVDLGAKDAGLGQALAISLGRRPRMLFTGSYLLYAAQKLGYGEHSLSALMPALRALNDEAIEFEGQAQEP
jgi:3-hydroxyisobutyrate dehydrogenase-like beta-hydroxyacid dehydrogenase